MTERTRRATEAAAVHADYIDACRPGSAKDMVERGLLDVTRDPTDVRYGHDKFIYNGLGFQGMLREIASEAMTFSVTTQLMAEIQTTLEFFDEEGIDFVPLSPEVVPCNSGFVMFPYGIDISDVLEFVPDNHLKTTRQITRRGIETSFQDFGGGDRWYIDGFMWGASDRVAADSDLSPKDGMAIFPLTRWRGRDGDRPFRLQRAASPDMPIPELVASDSTGWAWDYDGQEEWQPVSTLFYKDGTPAEQMYQEFNEAIKLKLRLLFWTVWKWMAEEIWIPERPDRPTQRRLSRMRPDLFPWGKEPGTMTIVDLRPERREHNESNGPGEPVFWRGHWKVRDHWARRRVAIVDENGRSAGPVKGPKAVYGVTYDYKWVKIKEHKRGPRDLPLIEKEKVGVLWR